jgi:hypothetical protein
MLTARKMGHALFMDKGCSSCHKVNISGLGSFLSVVEAPLRRPSKGGQRALQGNNLQQSVCLSTDAAHIDQPPYFHSSKVIAERAVSVIDSAS